MSELYDILVETPPTKVILLALDQGLWDCERSLAELAALCEANHMEAVAQITQKRQTPETGIVLGSGKLEEASLAAETLGAECAVFDGELTGSQIRNLSAALQVEVLDRTMLILEIFRAFHQVGVTVVIATNDPQWMARLSPRVLRLERGRLLAA